VGQEAEETLCKQLTDLVATQLRDAHVRVSGLQRLTGGASSETWSFDAVLSDGSAVPLILRREPPGLSRPGSMSNEARSFQAAARVGVPEPRIVAYDDDPGVLGSPFIVMERIDGETIARRILRDDSYRDVRPRLAAQCGELLARIHSIPAADLPGLVSVEPLAQARQRLDLHHPPSPACELGYRWLVAHRPEDTSVTVVHGDFRNGNFIVGPEGIRAVLDWERVHVGDPMEDLGWLCVKAWRFGSPDPVGGFGPLEDLFESYERAGGRRVHPETVRWWQVLGTLRWALGCMDMAERHLSGTVRSVELATIGRRVCEQEYDLLRLIEDDLT
jgi:aminoglycoside phosphotransferase (APT) family kinase protein